MIIYDFQDAGNLYFSFGNNKHKPVRFFKVHCVLFFSVAFQLVAFAYAVFEESIY